MMQKKGLQEDDIQKLHTMKQQTEQQATGAALKRVMSERERESEVIETDNDITTPDACAQEPLSLRCKL